MRIDWDTPISELMHSSDIRYIDLDEGELMHWKYIKREKLSNGKYRYYYHDDAYERAKYDYENKKRAADNAALARDSIISKNQTIIDEINRDHNARYGEQAGNDTNWPIYFGRVKRYVEQNNEATYKANEAAKLSEQAEVSYKKAKKLYDESSGHKVANLLNSASEKIDKAVTWLTNLFKKRG